MKAASESFALVDLLLLGGRSVPHRRRPSGAERAEGSSSMGVMEDMGLWERFVSSNLMIHCNINLVPGALLNYGTTQTTILLTTTLTIFLHRHHRLSFIHNQDGDYRQIPRHHADVRNHYNLERGRGITHRLDLARLTRLSLRTHSRHEGGQTMQIF